MEIPETIVKKEFFLERIPKAPQGRYVHLVLVRETESFPIFQTDGSLNIAKVRAGLKEENNRNLTRLAMFKRKQSSPERLTGRELLRRFGITQNEDKEGEAYCDYNEQFCQQCPDCVYYGFAIGESGSEKSKVYVDTAFSITGYDESHHQFSFNALFERGNISQHGKFGSGFGEQDHIVPQVFFPGVVTIKDATVNSFVYVMNNVIRTKRYGAQNTRTGKMENHIVGLVFADGEIFSNLKLTQAVYDYMAKQGQLEETPLNRSNVLNAVKTAISPLLAEDGVSFQVVTDAPLLELVEMVKSVTTDETKLAAFLQEATEEAKEYSQRVIQKPKSSKKS
ncbi:type I-D CRISPR-associated protein Cas7/Csc2 [Candidatus Poribacteria bacterium]|nr:type I-D CRISPR-associated protein Cas7/Csc2 [Candidatus Poribacteria bacterium]